MLRAQRNSCLRQNRCRNVGQCTQPATLINQTPNRQAQPKNSVAPAPAAPTSRWWQRQTARTGPSAQTRTASLRMPARPGRSARLVPRPSRASQESPVLEPIANLRIQARRENVFRPTIRWTQTLHRRRLQRNRATHRTLGICARS